MVCRMRFHGRGGEGVRLASRIVGRAAFMAGFWVQDFPLFGAERRGAPVVAFTRFSEESICERGYIDRPDVLVVLDESLLDDPEAAVIAGVDADAMVLVNSARSGDELRRRHAINSPTVTFDVTSVVLAALRGNLLGAAMAGFAVRATDLAPWPVLARAVRHELAEMAIVPSLVDLNVAATQQVFAAAPFVGRPTRALLSPAAGTPFVVPRLPARFAAPTIRSGATSARRRTADWRLFRPVIDQTGCTRCFVCFALCPEGAIYLDGDDYPHVDYQHCKGCLICVSECPPHAIAEERERVV